MIEIRIEHTHDVVEVQRRIGDVASRHDITIDPAADGLSGRLEKKVMLVGAVRANYTVAADHLLVEVIEAPAALADTIRRLLEDELGRALG